MSSVAAQLLALAAEAPTWAPADAAKVEPSGRDLPEIVLPGGTQTISDTASELGKLLAATNSHFTRGGAVVRVTGDEHGHPSLAPVRPAELASDAEQVACLVKIVTGEEGPESRPTTCSESNAKLIMAARTFVEELPPLRVLSRCPVLVERDGSLVEIVGYDRATGILTEGPPPQVVSPAAARAILGEALDGFRFATDADYARALAAFITPAMVFGGLLPGRPPVDLGEADQSQTGKGYRNKLTAAIYRHTPVAISQQHAGVGSLEEAFDRALIAGKTFIALDNVRGKVDSQKIESFLTEDTYYARAAYQPNTEIDPRRVYVMFTSNKADMTTDLANRSSCVRILKQRDGYQFATYPTGDILAHIRANQPLYLGAVFAIIRAWHAAGKPRSNETRHDFRAWAQSLDWIVQELLGAAPLLDGHRETQQRMTNPAMNWLRDVALAVAKQGKADRWLIAADLLEVIDADGSIDIPGLRDGADLEDEPTRAGVLRQMGRKLKRCFGDLEAVTLDGLTVSRKEAVDDQFRQRHFYQTTILVPRDAPRDERGVSIDGAANVLNRTTGNGRNGTKTDDPRDAPRDTPAMRPAINPDTPAIPASLQTINVCAGAGATPLSEMLGRIAGSRGIAGEDGSPSESPKAATGGRAVVTCNGRKVVELW